MDCDYVTVTRPPEDSGTSIIIKAKGDSIMFAGPDDDPRTGNGHCGKCGALIAKNVFLNNIRVLAVCRNCESCFHTGLRVRRPNQPIPTPHKIKKIRCANCVHTNLILMLSREGTFVELLRKGVSLQPIDMDKFTWIVTCAKCGKDGVHILPLGHVLA